MDSVKLIITLLVGGGFVGLILQSRYLKSKNRELKSKDKINSIQASSVSSLLKGITRQIEMRKKIHTEKEKIKNRTEHIVIDGTLTEEIQNEAKEQIVRTNVDSFDIVNWD